MYPLHAADKQPLHGLFWQAYAASLHRPGDPLLRFYAEFIAAVNTTTRYPATVFFFFFFLLLLLLVVLHNLNKKMDMTSKLMHATLIYYTLRFMRLYILS